MKQYKKAISITVGTIIIFVLLSDFKIDKKDNYTVRQTKKIVADSIPRLLSIYNLGDRNFTDNGYFITTLSEHTNNPEKKIKSISVYRFSPVTHSMILQDSIILNKEGKPVVRMTPYNTRFSTTYFFYDDKGNGFLDITLLENNYDTLYTLTRFDRFNRANFSIQYGITRKEFNYITETDVTPLSDTVVHLKRIKYYPDIKYKKMLPGESNDMLIKQVNDSLVNVITKRIVYIDTSYNSTYKSRLKIENNSLVAEYISDRYTYNSLGDWIERKNDQFEIQRKFTYYATNENEIKSNLSAKNSILKFLYSQMDSIPLRAWKNYNEMQNSFEVRAQMVANRTYGDSIKLQEANTIEAFLPKLWYQVSEGSGNIPGIDSMCYVIGYNTPIKGDDDNYKRCLAIYVHRNGKYRLIKQSFGAIDYFYDTDNDLLFDGNDETNFSVEIQDGDIIVHYEYMRGEASDEFAFEKGNWILVRCASGHRTCCQFESSSYDYKTKTYSSSISSFGDDNDNESGDMPRDTSITRIQNRPVMYMDSVTIKGFEYDKDGGY